MDLISTWKTPMIKQCFVCFGVALSAMEMAQVLTFTSILLPQLKQTKYLDLSEEEESWIASICGMSHMIGILIIPSLMGTFGRRTANVISNGILTVSWVSLALSSDYHIFLIVRFIQGFPTGMNSILAPVILGEYSSPKYRGAFLTTLSLSIAFGVFANHTLSVFVNWMHLSLIYAGVALLNCLIIISSPETPSFLAARGRYEECRKSFHWLRYPEEEVELERLIKANMRESITIDDKATCLDKVRKKYNYMLVMVKKKEFYKPVILMFHLHIINEWSGSNIFDAYTVNIYSVVIGSDVNASLIMISTDILRMISNFAAIIIIRKVRRRLILFITIALELVSIILIAAHVYAKSLGITTFDHPTVGIMLIYFHAFMMSIGSLPLPNIISGEIFCLQYRGISSMITSLFFCVNMIINMKTALYLFATIGLHGAYLIYAGLVTYGLMVSLMMLPETKDKTLQDIEEEFKGEKNVLDSEDPFFSDTVNLQ